MVKTLVGDTIIMREIIPEQDAQAWFHHMQEEKLHYWTGNTIPKNMDEVVTLLKRYKSLPHLTAWVITLKTTREVIGTYWMMKPVKKNGQKIIESEAQRLAVTYWRKGIMKEARSLVYDYAFNALEIDAIYAQAWRENENSCKSMENAGYVLSRQYERTFEKIRKVCIEKEYVLERINYERVFNKELLK